MSENFAPSWRSSKRLYQHLRGDLQRLDAHSVTEEQLETPPSGHRQDNFRHYLRTVALFRWKIVFIMFLAIIVTLLEAFQPRLIGEVVDKILTSSNPSIAQRHQQLVTCTLLLLGMVVAARFIDAWRDYRTHALNTRMMSRIRRLLYGHLLRLPISRLHEIKTGGIVSRLTGDLEQLTGLIQMAFISPTVALLRVIVTFAIVCFWNLKLALVLVLLLGPMAFGSVLWLGPIRKIWHFHWKRKGEYDSRISETFGGIRVVRAFQSEEAEEIRNAVTQHTLARLHLYAVRYTATVNVLWSVLIPLANVVVVYVGGRLIFEGAATIGQIAGLMAYTGMLMTPVYQIVQTFGDLQKSMASVDRVFDHLREPDEWDDPPDAVEAPKRIERIDFEHVDFGYSTDKQIIRDFCLSVPNGATVALVGASGAGKSTLADLIARFYRPTGGQIKLNGIPAEHVKLYSYRRLLGIVSQDVFLFDGTIAENIAYGEPHASREAIIDAARRANAHDFISDLPHGYETRTGERGTRLSGGQRQRLSIARAILADPQIMILDEATSALDSRSERLIQQAIEALEENRTTFVIAHRLSTIAKADIIVVLEQGQILEKGSHAELMDLRGRYWHMVEQQREGFLTN
jgi:ATP-binding cassette, subfamily B, bacterial